VSMKAVKTREVNHQVNSCFGCTARMKDIMDYYDGTYLWHIVYRKRIRTALNHTAW
jgi:hypothetical protein